MQTNYSDLSQDLSARRQSDAAHFCENCAKFYFDAKYLKKGLNREW